MASLTFGIPQKAITERLPSIRSYQEKFKVMSLGEFRLRVRFCKERQPFEPDPGNSGGGKRKFWVHAHTSSRFRGFFAS
jgi:hypothetical protein